MMEEYRTVEHHRFPYDVGVCQILIETVYEIQIVLNFVKILVISGKIIVNTMITDTGFLKYCFIGFQKIQQVLAKSVSVLCTDSLWNPSLSVENN